MDVTAIPPYSNHPSDFDMHGTPLIPLAVLDDMVPNSFTVSPVGQPYVVADCVSNLRKVTKDGRTRVVGSVQFACPFCWTSYKKNGIPSANARRVIHQHGYGSCARRSHRCAHCDSTRGTSPFVRKGYYLCVNKHTIMTTGDRPKNMRSERYKDYVARMTIADSD